MPVPFLKSKNLKMVQGRETPRNEKTEEPARACSFCPEVEGNPVQIPARDEKAVPPSPPKQPVHTRNSEMAEKKRKNKKRVKKPSAKEEESRTEVTAGSKEDPPRATPTEEVKEPPPPKKIRAKEVKDPPKAAKTTKPEPPKVKGPPRWKEDLTLVVDIPGHRYDLKMIRGGGAVALILKNPEDKKLAVEAIEREPALRLGGFKRARRELILLGVNSDIKEETLRDMVVLQNSGCGDFLEGYMRLYPKSTRRPYATNWVISGLKEATMKSLLVKKRAVSGKIRCSANLRLLEGEDGFKTQDLKETLDLILDRHFGNEEPEDEISLTTCGLVDPPFSENEVKQAAFKFGNRKSPGPDGIDNTIVKALGLVAPKQGPEGGENSRESAEDIGTQNHREISHYQQ
ncbi:hypothetical protein LAZ67_22000705 [Cordylochernes scorpioides]|uniref:Uncharacterized protein n=1 Tax=Cordylochernes scorpioides TaxID=51811 RepID=A0ABY6LRG2_9ARAC|nr:hypothetical protein LAZ67_22000705 [Cordylochernes scorpioides]